MAITAVILDDRTQLGGSKRNALIEYTDSHDGSVLRLLHRVSTAVDLQTWADGRATKLDLNRRHQEEQNAIARVTQGEDALGVVQSFSRSTEKRLAKTLLFWMMRERDPKIVLLLEPLILYLRANFNAAQLRNFLDLTNAQLTKLNTKVNYVLDNKAAFEGVEAETDEEFGGGV